MQPSLGGGPGQGVFGPGIMVEADGDIAGATEKLRNRAALRPAFLRTGKGRNTSTTLYWGRSGGTFAYIWNQSKDTGYLRNARGQLVHSCSYNSSRSDYKNC